EEVEEETIEDLKEEQPEEPKVTEEPNVLEKPEVKEKPEIQVTPGEEEVEIETIEDLKEEKPEEPKVTEEPKELEKPEVSNKQEVQNQSEVSSSKESDKQSKSLPQTGGVSTESTSILAGLFALILGTKLFRRRKM
ncbi:TPA: LPXTG cell wall anchor domain-containing protein, partial [Bacillus cereus]